MIKAAEIPRSTYYYWEKRLEAPDKHQAVRQEILRIFREEHKCRLGYRRVTSELRKTRQVNHKTVQRLMQEMGLYSVARRRRPRHHRGPQCPVAHNLYGRDFTAAKPYEKWATDVTEFAVLGERLYLSAVLDLYNREIVGYSVGGRQTMELVMSSVAGALQQLPEVHKLTLHSDQGWHYRMSSYQVLLAANSVRQSMSRRGNCLDNAVMESFFGVLKTEWFYGRHFESIQQFCQELDEYISYYNHRRPKLCLNGLSPVEYRQATDWVKD